MVARRRALVLGGYAGFALLSLIFSLYLTLPADAIAQRLGHELQRATHGAWTLTYAEASPWRLTGVALRQVVMHRQAPGAEALQIPVDTLRARLRLLPLLLGRVSLGTDLALGTGSLKVRVTPRAKGALDLDVEAQHLDLGSPPLLGKLVGFGVGGILDGRAIISSQRQIAATRADLDLTWEGGTLGPGALMGMTLPQLPLGHMALTAELRDGRAKVQHFEQQGGGIALRLRGGANLREPFSTSTLDGCVQIRAEPTFVAKNPNVGSLFSLAEVQLKRDGDGFLHAPVAGPLGQPRLTGGLCR